MTVEQYSGPGWLVSPSGAAIPVTLTLSGDGLRWQGEARPAAQPPVFPGWLHQGLVVTVRTFVGGRSEARVGPVSLDHSQPLPLTGTQAWPG